MTTQTPAPLFGRWLPLVPGSLALVLAIAGLLHLPDAFSTFHPGALLFTTVNLLLALLCALAALSARRRFRQGLKSPGALSWAVLGIFLATLLTPSFYIWVSTTELPDGYLDEGFGVSKRSLSDVLKEGWSTQRVDARPLQIRSLNAYGGRDEVNTRPCIAALETGSGFLSVVRQYSWFHPGQQLKGEKPDDALQACQDFRQALVQHHGGLESTLLDPDATAGDIAQRFHHNLADQGQLLLQWSDLPTPHRQAFQALLFNDERLRDATLTLFDVALMLKDDALIRASLPAEGAVPHQRYALYQLGLSEILAPFPPVKSDAEERVSFWSVTRVDPIAIENIAMAGNYGEFDYAIANLTCDTKYAQFLARRDLRPSSVFASDLVNQLIRKEKRAQPENRSLTYEDFPAHKLTHNAVGNCAALARFYAEQPDIFTEALSSTGAREMAAALGDIILKAYQSVAREALAVLPEEKRRDHHSREADEIYATLVFSAGEYPVPDSLLAYVNLFADRFHIGAVCGTLAYSPWALRHPEITEAYRKLWQGWQGQLPEDIALQVDEACSIPLINPPNLYTWQTALRNELLSAADIACEAKLETIEGWYVRSVLECTP